MAFELCDRAKNTGRGQTGLGDAGKHWCPEGAAVTSVSGLEEGAALLQKSCLVRIVERVRRDGRESLICA